MKTLLSSVLIALAALIAAPTMADEAPKQDKKEKPAKEEKKGEKKSDKKEEKAAKVKPYPLKTCLVTDNDLKSMGDPVTYIHEGQEIKFCCQPCEKKFLKEPAKYLEKLPKAGDAAK